MKLLDKIENLFRDLILLKQIYKNQQAEEKNQLRLEKFELRQRLIKEVKKLSDEGKSIRQIAFLTNVSKSCIHSWLNEIPNPNKKYEFYYKKYLKED